MPDHPLVAADRERRRQQILDEQILAARRIAARVGRSVKCGEYGQHADQEGGCANDGTGCLCECHDREDRNA